MFPDISLVFDMKNGRHKGGFYFDEKILESVQCSLGAIHVGQYAADVCFGNGDAAG